jgi:hypothetical protein
MEECDDGIILPSVSRMKISGEENSISLNCIRNGWYHTIVAAYLLISLWKGGCD